MKIFGVFVEIFQTIFLFLSSILQTATAHMNLGAILHLNGKLEEAERSYKEALRLKPDDSMTKDNLAKLQNLMHNHVRAAVKV